MIEYSYKGFQISYEINLSKDHLYKADGKAIKQDKKIGCSPQKFHTEALTEAGAKAEIKKLIENYVDFEWKEFYEMH